MDSKLSVVRAILKFAHCGECTCMVWHIGISRGVPEGGFGLNFSCSGSGDGAPISGMQPTFVNLPIALERKRRGEEAWIPRPVMPCELLFHWPREFSNGCKTVIRQGLDLTADKFEIRRACDKGVMCGRPIECYTQVS
jgi:hypothetical protein